MKPVEEAFASEAFRRIVLPGIVLTVGFHPLVSMWTPLVETLYGVGAAVFIVTEVIFFGLLVSSAIQWIYYVYEGFRLKKLTALAGWISDRRVATFMAMRAASSDEDRKVQAYEYLIDFPLRQRDGSVEHYAERPTRLGNIIATYELYAQSRYNIDGVFYWNHLLNLASDQARKEFKEQYAFAESLVLTSFSGALVAVLHTMVLVGFAIGAWRHDLAVITLRIGPRASVSLLTFGLVMWLLFYRAALPAHREAGMIFRSIVDAVVPAFVGWAIGVRVPLPQSAVDQISLLTDYLKEPQPRGPEDVS